MVDIAVIGIGYWGPNYVRAFSELPGSRVKWCCDLDGKKLASIKKRYPEVKTTADHTRIAADRSVKGVVITTSVAFHFELAKYFLDKGKNVYIEKPFTTKVFEAEELIELARRKKAVLMVGHIYLFHPAVKKLKQLIKNDVFGEIYYLRSERMGLGPIRKHASALWDLATHDISIALFLLEKLPVRTAASGGSYLQKNITDFVDLNLSFPEGVHLSIFATWYAPEKVRRLTIVGSQAMAVFDDMDKFEPLRIFERKVEKKKLNSTPKYEDHQNMVSVGGVHAPAINPSEPLKNAAKSFLDCIVTGRKPLTSGKNGLDVIKILEAADNLLSRN